MSHILHTAEKLLGLALHILLRIWVIGYASGRHVKPLDTRAIAK